MCLLGAGRVDFEDVIVRRTSHHVYEGTPLTWSPHKPAVPLAGRRAADVRRAAKRSQCQPGRRRTISGRADTNLARAGIADTGGAGQTVGADPPDPSSAGARRTPPPTRLVALGLGRSTGAG